MITRQKILLQFIKLAGSKATKLQLMKWAFLFSKKKERINNFYEFVPYQYGPFSFTLYHELESLYKSGIINKPCKHEVSIKPDSHFSLDFSTTYVVNNFWEKYHKYRLSELINETYENYSWYTINSTLKKRQKETRPIAECAIYTAGYEGLSVDGFINLLLKKGIKRILDVRRNPISRRYGYHKKTLASICHKLEIDYMHFPDVGIPSEWRKEIVNNNDYSFLFEKYKKELIPHVMDTVRNIDELMQETPSVLLCQEADPIQCHRTHLAEQIATIDGMEIRDLRVTT